MSSKLISIPYYVGGSARFSDVADSATTLTVDGHPCLSVPRCSQHTLSAAIATAQFAQPRLASLSSTDIGRVLARTMAHFLATPESLAVVVSLTGSSMKFVEDGIRLVKDWAGALDPFLAAALPDATARYRGSAPVVLVLPSNEVQETPLVVSQVLLSRCASIVRPSQNGAGAYLTTQFVAAMHCALDELADTRLEVLRLAVSVVHTDPGNYLEKLALDGWNYVFFGDSKTGEQVTRTLHSLCTPRKILIYGTGLSMTVFARSGNLSAHLPEIIDSVTVNAGNECISTDILYVETSRYPEVLEQLSTAMASQSAGAPGAEGSI
ncbi:MAG: aldehyde dehydrogenase family protein, partial [Rhodoferax sp.]